MMNKTERDLNNLNTRKRIPLNNKKTTHLYSRDVKPDNEWAQEYFVIYNSYSIDNTIKGKSPHKLNPVY